MQEMGRGLASRMLHSKQAETTVQGNTAFLDFQDDVWVQIPTALLGTRFLVLLPFVAL